MKLIHQVGDGPLDASPYPRRPKAELNARILAYLDDINRDPVIHHRT